MRKKKEGWQCNFGMTSSLLFTRLNVHDSEVKFDGPAEMVNGSKLENLDLVDDPAKNFAVIMKDGKICKNTVKQPSSETQVATLEDRTMKQAFTAIVTSARMGVPNNQYE